MCRNQRFATVLLLACTSTFSLCSAAGANNEPNAVELVRAVRESENWLHRINSLRLRIEGKWSRSPESIAAKYAELKKQYPDQEPDPNRYWGLKPSESDMLEYTIDFKKKRLRYVMDTPDRSYFLGIWDGKQAMGYSSRLQHYTLDSDKEMFEKLFGSLSWPRAQPHSFWWEPQNIEEKIDHFGRADDFKIIGLDEYRGVDCHILECMSRSDDPVTFRWYVGVEDHLLYGRQDWINPEFVFEYWTLDYKQAAPGCRIPMTQGYNFPEYDAVKKKYYISCRREARVIDVRVNEALDDELFEMKFEEGLYVADRRSGNTVVYRYIATPLSLIGKPLPDFENITIEFDTKHAQDKMILICFFDIEQRPSRNCIMQLAKQTQRLTQKGVAVMAIQSSEIDENMLNEWIKENDNPFPMGMIEDDEKQTRFNWGIKSLPWIILTDKQHIVVAEGFGLDELDAKIREIVLLAGSPVDSNEVTGLVKDPNGQVLSGVLVTEFQTDKDYKTDAEGRFISAFGPSDERRFFFAVDKQRKLVGTGLLPPGETHVEVKLAPARMVSGMVVDSAGKPVAGAQVAPLPMTCFYVLTDDRGRFDVGWNPEWAGRLKKFFLMARHLGRNLAGGIEIDENARMVRIEIEPALTLTGTVEEPNGVPISGAEVGLSLRRGWACGTPVKKVITDEKGGYTFPTLPQRQEYINYARAEGFWRNQITTGIINRITDGEKVGPIILKRPILSVSGKVLNVNGEFVADIPVYLEGEGQPDLDSKTDAEGRFIFEKICSGPVRISAKNNVFFGKIETEGGTKNVKLVVQPRFK